jgi:hypothetical protein
VFVTTLIKIFSEFAQTTITKQIIEHYQEVLDYSENDILRLDGDLLSTQRLLSPQELKPLQNLVGKSKMTMKALH